MYSSEQVITTAVLNFIQVKIHQNKVRGIFLDFDRSLNLDFQDYDNLDTRKA